MTPKTKKIKAVCECEAKDKTIAELRAEVERLKLDNAIIRGGNECKRKEIATLTEKLKLAESSSGLLKQYSHKCQQFLEAMENLKLYEAELKKVREALSLIFKATEEVERLGTTNALNDLINTIKGKKEALSILSQSGKEEKGE